MKDKISKFKQKCIEYKILQDIEISRKNEISKNLSELNRSSINIEQAQKIIQEVAKLTQQEIIFHIEDIVTESLQTIFSENYSFKIEIEIKRKSTEVKFILIKDGQEIDPKNSVGGGVVDVLSFALRISLWMLHEPRSEKIMILDEPFKFLARPMQEKASEFIKTLSERIGIQFIIISHDDAIINCADKIFSVKIKEGNSEVCES